MDSCPCKVDYTVQQLLDNGHASSLLATNDGEIHFLWQHQLLFDAFEQLVKWNVLSAPVLNDQGDDIFVISIAGIMNRFFQEVDLEDLKRGKLGAFKNVPLVQLVGIEEVDPAVAVRWDSSLREVVEKMVSQRAHRALVYGKNEEISNLVTQSRVIEYLSTALDFLPIVHKPIEELQLGSEQVHAVRDSASSFDAFQSMREKKLSGLPIVNERGEMIGHISASDFKHVGHHLEHWDLLLKPVTEFQKAIESGQREQGKEQKPPVISCAPSDLLLAVIRDVVRLRVHRVYVTDDSKRPRRVIALHDILECLIKQTSSSH